MRCLVKRTRLRHTRAEGAAARPTAYAPGGAGHDVVEIRFLEAVEGGRGRDGVGPHVLKDQPVADLQLGQAAQLNDAVEAVARRPPDAAGVPDFVRLPLLLESGERLTAAPGSRESSPRLPQLGSPCAALAGSERGRRRCS